MLIAGAMALACSNDIENEGARTAELEILIDNNVEDMTKANTVATGAEKAVSSLKVYVYNEKGELEANPAVTSQRATANVVAGVKTIVAVANAEVSSSDAASLSGIRSAVTTLSENAGAFVMSGITPGVSVSENTSVSVHLKRRTAKVCLVSVSRNLSDASFASASLVIKDVFLSNVAGTTGMVDEQSPSEVGTWFHKMGYGHVKGTDCPTGIQLEATVNQSLAQGDTYSTEHVFYAYPNSSSSDVKATSESSAWSPRTTRLVIAAELAGSVTYYVIPVFKGGKGIEANKVYNIQANLVSSGSVSPDGAGETTPQFGVEVTVSVDDWDDAIAIVQDI